MIIGGYNKYFGLGEKSNKDIPFEPCISPPLLSHINISALRSYSIFDNHAVMITKEGQAFAIGSNENGQIINTISKEVHEREQLIEITDPQGNDCRFISAVCGHDYTLYLVTTDTTEINQLVYVYSNENNNHPLFLNINGRNPISLYGGWRTSAAIDSEEGIYVITKHVFSSPNHSIKRSFLPKGEKAISIACCNSFVIVATLSGRVFGSSLEDLETGRLSRLVFDPVIELEGEEIVDVCGTVENCLALSSGGQIFALGSNEWGQIGLGTKRTLTSKFTQILALRNFDIVAAASGCFHSLFVTSQGSVLSCGNNGCGQLLLKNGPTKNFTYLPVKSLIKSGCSFCIAGNNVSALFVDCEPPENMPNRAIRRDDKDVVVHVKRDKGVTGMREFIEQQAYENAKLKEENNRLRRKILSDEGKDDENAKLKEENSELKKIIVYLKEENANQNVKKKTTHKKKMKPKMKKFK